tara:strand:+ start:1338 stop:2129 length:792 start_codon:yes stop_codon:yes gene_type:complete
MLKVNRSKFEIENMGNFTKEQIEIKRTENRQATNSWLNLNSMPEKMYSIFNIYVKRKAEVQDKMVFVDIGAAEGCFSYCVAKNFENFNILAFEPESERLDIFEENLSFITKESKGSPMIEVNQVLVTDGSKDVESLRHYICDFTNGGAGSSRMYKADRPNRKWYDLKFDCVKMDDYVDKFDKVDAVKIDVEGAEIMVLNGAKKFIEKYKPAIFLEIHSHPDNGGVIIEDVKEAVANYSVDYEFNLIERHLPPMLSYYLLKPKG